jgi:hypothetical protein
VLRPRPRQPPRSASTYVSALVTARLCMRVRASVRVFTNSLPRGIDRSPSVSHLRVLCYDPCVSCTPPPHVCLCIYVASDTPLVCTKDYDSNHNHYSGIQRPRFILCCLRVCECACVCTCVCKGLFDAHSIICPCVWPRMCVCAHLFLTVVSLLSACELVCFCAQLPFLVCFHDVYYRVLLRAKTTTPTTSTTQASYLSVMRLPSSRLCWWLWFHIAYSSLCSTPYYVGGCGFILLTPLCVPLLILV